MSNKSPNRRAFYVGAFAVAVALVVAVVFLARRGGGPDADTYEQITRAFYRGLAALEVGLLDDARDQFRRATELVPDEPASWANLGLTHLRLGELDAAAEPIAQAVLLAPDNPDLVLLAGRMEIARGRLDEGVAHLRRAVELDADALTARFALAEEIERAAGPDADAEAMALLNELATLAPENAAVLIERARLAAKVGDAATLQETIARIELLSRGWPELALTQYQALRDAAAAGNFPVAQRSTAFLRNVLARVPSFIEGLSAVRTPTELIAEPIERFVVLPSPVPRPAPADMALTYGDEDLNGPGMDDLVALTLEDANGTVILAVDRTGIRRLDDTGGSWPLPPSTTQPYTLRALDWNNDFRIDLLAVGAGGLRLLLQGEDGSFRDETAATLGEAAVCDCWAAWGADVEMDGDLDVIASRADGPPLVLRNNGDGTAEAVEMFAGVTGVLDFVWADFDEDADPDAVFLDASGAVRLFTNRQAGDFVASPIDAASGSAALAAGDLDGDGVFDLVSLTRDGVLRRVSREGTAWSAETIGSWGGRSGDEPARVRLFVADLDNNGALDVVAAAGGASRIWLASESFALSPLESPAGEITAIADLDGDGRLDLVSRDTDGAARHLARGTADYHWKAIRPRAQAAAGDQRINSFAIGGEAQVRAGLLRQKQVMTGGPVHFGLGAHTDIDVVRIVWPNGVAQAEFDLDVDEPLVAEQRLKGSCPWLFAWDGSEMAFVADLLWRSPLGLRINAQDTAGVVQTEDWVRIRGDQLSARDGHYDLRITAELWETHFFDQVALLVVDHPDDTEVFVDERFSPASPPALAVHAVQDVRPVTQARDEQGNDVTITVSETDGQYLATFARGAYQGIAEEHYVEFDGPAAAGVSGGERLVLLANGWIYPTDSSINVAIGQGGHVRPMGLALEVQDAAGNWRVVNPDLGFPAGKHKTILIDLSRVRDARRLRLRTNLEIYWDALAYARPVDVELRTVRLAAATADLAYRGFSQTTSPRDASPETPHYDRIANVTPRWRDLEGYHTRFGDVRELVAGVDDRYVIMNAGDELRLRFPEQAPPPSGWRRDFVMIADGWEKDGDYNTGFSQTVLPLPSHDRPDYGAEGSSLVLEEDPVYQRYPEDWQTYHTRYVTPQRFVRGLR